MVLRSRLHWWQRIAYSWITLLVLLAASVLLGRGVWDMYQKNVKAQERKALAVDELTAVQLRQAGLSEELEHIKTRGGIEAELRHKFDVAKEGEHLLVIVDKEIEPEREVEELGFWGTILQRLRP